MTNKRIIFKPNPLDSTDGPILTYYVDISDYLTKSLINYPKVLLDLISEYHDDFLGESYIIEFLNTTICCSAPYPVGGQKARHFVIGTSDGMIHTLRHDGKCVSYSKPFLSGITDIAIRSLFGNIIFTHDGIIGIERAEKFDLMVIVNDEYHDRVVYINALPNGKIVAVSCYFLWIFDHNGIKCEAKRRLALVYHRDPKKITILTDGCIVISESNNLKIFNSNDLSDPKVIKTSVDTSCIASLHDGRVICGDVDGRMTIFNPITEKCDMIFDFESRWTFIQKVAVRPDGKIISLSYDVYDSSDRSFRIWDPDTGNHIATISNLCGSVDDFILLSDGSIVCAYVDFTLRNKIRILR